MPNATELCSTTDIKTLLGITSSSQDTLIALVKANVEAWVKNYCGRDFLATDYVEYYDGDDSNQLRLLQRPVNTITEIKCDPARLFVDASIIPTTDFIADAQTLRLGFVKLLTYKFLRGAKSTKVTYNAGYTTIPADLGYAVGLVVAKQFKVADKKLFAETSQTVGGMTITLSIDTYPKDAMKVIESYRRMDF